MLVEGGRDTPVDGGGACGGLCGFGQGEAVDGLAGGDDLSEAGLDLGQGTGELVDLFAQAVGACGGLVVFGLQQPQEFGDVQAANSTSSRQAGLRVVKRRSMPAVEAQ
ncbi:MULTISPECIES: hypothetical protein [unclassified Streptomyces]|uniref:hypothetical protein n=1 Tax=unclassified Streptomyces TaxID=2593676 RepID=UPI0019D30FC4|nr:MULTISPECIES: hypothetical protein [unclassified Streptomyces]WSC32801.1 hypothetical protein OG902_42410 [Streptomyces sp. NBC_01768]WSX06474.1 hypothetical protein OG355_41985 [Streptomyces sp. NBC_00987]